jgi:hypothetical protein
VPRLLFASSDRAEMTRTVKSLLLAGVRCEVRKERRSSSYGVWLQEERDFPRALGIWKLYAKPRPLPPWASVLESVVPASARAESADETVSAVMGQDEGSPEPASTAVAVMPRDATCVRPGRREFGGCVDGVWVIDEE